jgi:hypothetical protein
MKLELNDHLLGPRVIDTDKAEEVIRDQLQLLRAFQKANTSPHPEDLALDIQFYEWMLAQTDPRAVSESYLAGKSLLRRSGSKSRFNHEFGTEMSMPWRSQ